MDLVGNDNVFDWIAVLFSFRHRRKQRNDVNLNDRGTGG